MVGKYSLLEHVTTNFNVHPYAYCGNYFLFSAVRVANGSTCVGVLIHIMYVLRNTCSSAYIHTYYSVNYNIYLGIKYFMYLRHTTTICSPRHSKRHRLQFMCNCDSC